MYPEWQKRIREAQAQQKAEEDAAEQERLDAQKAANEAEDRRMAEAFKKVAAFMLLPEPESGSSMVVGEYEFKLNGYREWDNRPRRASEEKIPDTFRFNLFVTKPKPIEFAESYQDFKRYYPSYNHDHEWPNFSIEVEAPLSATNASRKKLAQLANNLDWLDEQCDRVLQEFKDYQVAKALRESEQVVEVDTGESDDTAAASVFLVSPQEREFLKAVRYLFSFYLDQRDERF